MQSYTFNFVGRLRGALGIKYGHTVTVEAESPREALLKLYETHEHISVDWIQTADGQRLGKEHHWL